MEKCCTHYHSQTISSDSMWVEFGSHFHSASFCLNRAIVRSQLQRVNVTWKMALSEWQREGCVSAISARLPAPRRLPPPSCRCRLWSCLSLRLSSSDGGARLPPPAQRSELQSLAAAAGHWHPLRGHQTVSFTRALCQQFALGGISTSCLNTTLINDAAESSSVVNIWYLALAFFFFFFFPRCCSTLSDIYRQWLSPNVSGPQACRTVTVIDGSSGRASWYRDARWCDDPVTRFYEDSAPTQCSRLLAAWNHWMNVVRVQAAVSEEQKASSSAFA